MLPSNRQAGLPAPTDKRGKGQGGLAPVQLGRVTHVHRKAKRVDVILDDLSVLEKCRVMGCDDGPDRESHDLPGKRSLVVVLFPYGTKDRPIVAGVLTRPGKQLADAPYDDDEVGGFFRRVFPSGAHVAVHPNGRVEVRAADGTFIVLGEDDAPKDDFTGQAREAWKGDPFIDPAAEPQTKPTGFHAIVKRPDGTSVHLYDGKITMQAPTEIDVRAPEIKLRSGSSGIAINSLGVTIVGPVFGWQATPITRAPFSPAGMQILVPVPTPSPFLLP